MKYAYYPGCSLHSTAKEYDQTSREVCHALGIELAEIDDWNCCGATSAHSLDHRLALELSARNILLAQAERSDMAIPCASCFNNLKKASIELEKNPAFARRMSEITGVTYHRKLQVKNLLDVVAGLDADLIKSKIVRPLKGLKVVSYYGCLLLRPPDMMKFDHPEQPESMDNLMEASGAEPVPWSYKTDCCGAGLTLTMTEVVVKLVGHILIQAKQAGANCLVTACPMCMANLDTRQAQAAEAAGEQFDLPVFYFTELLGLSFGMKGQDWWKKHLVDPSNLLFSIGLA
ncbi:MAG: CoB--CoM heterodisulfide reductase iron-sulfur subunit B family protein [bacterium]